MTFWAENVRWNKKNLSKNEMNLGEFVYSCSEISERIPEWERTTGGTIKKILGAKNNPVTYKLSLWENIERKDYLICMREVKTV